MDLSGSSPVQDNQEIEQSMGHNTASNSDSKNNSHNRRLKSLETQKKELEEQIDELEKLRNKCNLQIKGTTNLDTKSQLRARMNNYSTEINELYDEINSIEQQINRV